MAWFDGPLEELVQDEEIAKSMRQPGHVSAQVKADLIFKTFILLKATIFQK